MPTIASVAHVQMSTVVQASAYKEMSEDVKRRGTIVSEQCQSYGNVEATAIYRRETKITIMETLLNLKNNQFY